MRIAKKYLFAVLLPFVALAGCATLYQKEGVFTNGYSDYRSAPDTFIVTFRANEHTPREKVLEYALKRSAELTLKHGFHYFTVLEKHERGKGLHYPSLRLKVQCYHHLPQETEWLDAEQLLKKAD